MEKIYHIKVLCPEKKTKEKEFLSLYELKSHTCPSRLIVFNNFCSFMSASSITPCGSGLQIYEARLVSGTGDESGNEQKMIWVKLLLLSQRSS